MQYKLSLALVLCSLAFCADHTAVPLNVSAGVPLRLYLTQRLPSRLGEPVHARLAEPIFAFDREVVPAGTDVSGEVMQLDPVSKWRRFSAIIGGDFTPLHKPEVEFKEINLKDGKTIALETLETTPLNSIFSITPPKRKKPKKNAGATTPGNGTQSSRPSVLGLGKQEAKNRINGAINSRTHGVADLVRGPDKKERFQEFLLNKLPYHPQWVRKGTRFDAVLVRPLAFGTAQVSLDALQRLGTQPPPDSVVTARLITPLTSATAKQGETVEAIVVSPLFSDGKLILPEGTRLSGAVTIARRARYFHRGGQLRFNFQKIDLPEAIKRPDLAHDGLPLKTLAMLQAAESSSKNPIKVDEEGGVKATEPKTRLIAPALSILIAMKSADNDEGRSGVHDSNVSGRTLGGGSGFGLLGAAAAQASRTAGSALGFYGMAFSIYNNIISRGSEVEFGKNAALDIRFGARIPAQASKLKATSAAAGGGSL